MPLWDSYISSGSSVNPSIAWVRGKHGEGRFRIRFPLNSDWYNEQPDTRFQSLEHRKERDGRFGHEFIVLKLMNHWICRIERMGDPDASLDAISDQGTTAYDFAQSFPPDKLSDAHLETSDVVARITFPRCLDLKIVLLICRAMQEGEKTCNYTLQVFNCYFFALVIQAALTRFVADWRLAFTDETWHLDLENGLSALCNLYRTVSSAQDQQPFILRIYSALRPDTQWPTEDIIRNLKQELRQLTKIAQVWDAVLWHSDGRLAVDHTLHKRVRDAAMGILIAQVQPDDLLLKLVSHAISGHEQEPQTPKLSRVQRGLQRDAQQKIRLLQEFGSPPLEVERPWTKKWTLGLQRSKPQPGPSLSTTLPFFKASQLFIWLTYAKLLALWAFQVVLGLFWIYLPGSAQPTPCLLIEDELEPSLATLTAPKHNRTTFVSQKLRSLIAAPLLIQWKEWPWGHIYKPIKQHIPESLSEEERVLQVSFSNDDEQAMPVSEFQKHLLKRIHDHAKRVESFRLGSAAKIQDEMEDRISQVWALIRPDDATIAPTPPPVAEAPIHPIPYNNALGSPLHHEPTPILPDNYIPEMTEDGGIWLPPPHEMDLSPLMVNTDLGTGYERSQHPVIPNAPLSAASKTPTHRAGSTPPASYTPMPFPSDDEIPIAHDLPFDPLVPRTPAHYGRPLSVTPEGSQTGSPDQVPVVAEAPLPRTSRHSSSPRPRPGTHHRQDSDELSVEVEGGGLVEGAGPGDVSEARKPSR